MRLFLRVMGRRKGYLQGLKPSGAKLRLALLPWQFVEMLFFTG